MQLDETPLRHRTVPWHRPVHPRSHYPHESLPRKSTACILLRHVVWHLPHGVGHQTWTKTHTPHDHLGWQFESVSSPVGRRGVT